MDGCEWLTPHPVSLPRDKDHCAGGWDDPRRTLEGYDRKFLTTEMVNARTFQAVSTRYKKSFILASNSHL